VTVAIALFLLGGLLTIVQNVRQTDINQRAMSQLQDSERFALTVITDVVQAGGYLPDPVAWTPATSLLPVAGTWEAGQALYGRAAAAPPGDTLQVRFRTALNDGVILCDGSTNTTPAWNTHAFTNTFSVVQVAGNPALSGLYCQVDNLGSAAAPGILLVAGVVNMKVYYGVKRDFTFSDYNVDTYLTADKMCSAITVPCGSDDWSNVSSVRVILTFTNPLAAQPGQQPTIQFERVIEVMGRAGVHT
jgi:type IV pilus assembly protein PilW